ncbi:hypothetical protein ACFO4E_03695 [Nocardiopsis mangrovi]|uniref:Uncharacterized protein n=1 Tax=Nocardiopsis mangrovi TaxID=1179818 RepID=A0ABV9DQK1_9ACTN
MSWRLARSLATLRAEINTAAPDRSKRSDGSIGDAAHRASASDHNPNAAGVVCAIDITHDPDAGADMAEVAEQLRAGGHPALKYLRRRQADHVPVHQGPPVGHHALAAPAGLFLCALRRGPVSGPRTPRGDRTVAYAM